MVDDPLFNDNYLETLDEPETPIVEIDPDYEAEVASNNYEEPLNPTP